MKSSSVPRRSVLAALPLGGAVIAALVAPPATAEPQPAMGAALEALKSAAASLQNATPDKGGHRAKALGLTKRAIQEVVLGIRYDNRR
jgi:hypothetical protein